MRAVAALFKALSDPTRLRLATLLARHGETCVCHLARALREPDYKISRGLGALRASGLVEGRREGAWTYYRLASPAGDRDASIQRLLREAFAANPTACADLARLREGAHHEC